MKCGTANLAVLPQKWGTQFLSWKEQWGLCWVFQFEGRAANQLWKQNFSCEEPNRSTGILHNSFLSLRGCSWEWPGVMGSKSSLNSTHGATDLWKKCYSHSVQLGFACLLSQYSPTSALRKSPKMHSRPSVCTERWFIQLVWLGSAFTEALQCGCSRNWGHPVPVQSFPPSQSPCFIWGKFFSQSNLQNFYRILLGSRVPVKCTQCWQTFTDVTKEINPAAVVCPNFCFLWKVKWKWNNQTWIPSQNPAFPGKIWFSCLSSTLKDVFFCAGWDCGWVEFLLGSCCLFCPVCVTPDPWAAPLQSLYPMTV